MHTLRSGNAVWLVRPPVEPRSARRRARAGMLARAAGLAGFVAAVALGLAPGPAPATGSAESTPRASANAKDGSRLPGAQAAERAPVSRLFDPRAMSAAQARFAVAPEPAVTGSLTLAATAPAAASPAWEWREIELSQVEILDGRTLATPTLRLRLAGIELPKADEACRTLDGRLEACVARAATQLELITRSRKLACRYRPEGVGEGAGSCRIGTSDLAERLLRAGYVKPAGERVATASAQTGN